jgi:thiol-disulfide isomerase/thioredoxin
MTYAKTIKLQLIFLIFSSSLMAQTLHVSGNVQGIQEGSWIYISRSAQEKALDSAKVTGSKFNLSAKTGKNIAQLIIYTQAYKNYVFFWAEQHTHLVLKNGEFKKAVITGSKTQAEKDKYVKRLEPNSRLQDSLSKLLSESKDDAEKKALRQNIRSAKDQEEQMEIAYVQNNPESLISAYTLSVYASTWDREQVTSLYLNLTPEIKNSDYGKDIQTFIRLNKEIKIGGLFADFEQTNINGKKIRLSDFKGKYVLLDFWGSWCPPCREESPNLVKVYKAYKNKGFQILGVAADDNKQNWLNAVKEDGMTWENFCDLKGDKNEATLIYGINAYPTNYLINDKGIIIAKNLRGEMLEKKLAELLP